MEETSEGNTPIPPQQRTRQRRNQQFEGLEEYNFQVDSRTGWRTYPLKSHGNLRHPASSASSSSAPQWDPHDDWKEKVVNSDFFSSEEAFSACRQLNSLAIDLVCTQIHLPHATFPHAQSSHSAHSTFITCSSLAQGQGLSAQNTISHPRMINHFAPHLTRNTSTRSFSPSSPLSLSSSTPRPDLLSPTPSIHCKDPRKGGSFPEHLSSTRYEPKRIELNRILVKPQNQGIDDQEDIEEIGVKPLIHSAYDSAESIATPPDSDLEDEQLRMMLASPLYTEVSGKLDAECVQK